MQLKNLLILFLPIMLHTVESARILAVLPLPKSHYKFCKEVVLAVAERGHEIVLINPLYDDTIPKNITQVSFGLRSILEAFTPKQLKEMMDLTKRLDFISSQHRLWNMMNMNADYLTINLTTVNDFILKDNSHFDLIMVEDFYLQAFYGFAHKYNAPLILISSFGNGHYISEYTGNSLELSYVPHEFSDLFSNLTFFERAKNLFYSIYDIAARKYFSLEYQNEVSKRIFGHLKDLPHVSELERNAALVIVNGHYSMSIVQPLLPNIIYVGGIHIKEAKALDSKVKTILDTASKGVILFSLGSVLDLSEQPEPFTIEILNALGRLEQKVILKWATEKPMPVKHDNIYAFDWLQQNEILAHENTVAFVTHGGLNSAQETVYYGVPVICVPFFGDQFTNCLKSVKLGYGISIDNHQLTEQRLFDALRTLTSESKFKMAAKEISRRFRDRPLGPKELIVYWTEYILNHKGANFLKSPKRDMYWYQILFLDLLAIIFISFWVMKKIVNKIFKSLFSRKSKVNVKSKVKRN